MNNPIFQFYVELDEYEPKMWRRFIIDSDSTMMTLASLIIYSFNAKASHIYTFDIPAKNLDVQIYIDKNMNADDDAFMINELNLEPKKHVDARNTRIKECFEKIGDCGSFTYDFGDNWKFIIKREEFEPVTPCILDGEGLGIIEDCGGIPMLGHIQEVFSKKSGEEYEALCGWLGRKTLDLNKFNKDKINADLEKNIEKFNRTYWNKK